MRNKTIATALIFLAVGVLLASAVRAQDDEDEEETQTTGVKKYGFVHNIAQDRKLVKVGGLYEPEGLDLYLKRLFDGLASKMERLEAKIDRIERRLSTPPAEKTPAKEKSA